MCLASLFSVLLNPGWWHKDPRTGMRSNLLGSASTTLRIGASRRWCTEVAFDCHKTYLLKILLVHKVTHSITSMTGMVSNTSTGMEGKEPTGSETEMKWHTEEGSLWQCSTHKFTAVQGISCGPGRFMHISKVCMYIRQECLQDPGLCFGGYGF